MRADLWYKLTYTEQCQFLSHNLNGQHRVRTQSNYSYVRTQQQVATMCNMSNVLHV